MNAQDRKELRKLSMSLKLVMFKLNLAVWDFLRSGLPVVGEHEIEVRLGSHTGRVVVSVGEHDERYFPTQTGAQGPFGWFPLCQCHIRETMFKIEETVGELAWLVGPGRSRLPEVNGGKRIPNYVMGMSICAYPSMRQGFERLVDDMLVEADTQNISINYLVTT